MANIDSGSLWESVLAELQLTLSGANFQTWFKGKTNILSINNSLIEVGCATPYNKTWIEERYLGKIKEIVDRVTGKPHTLVFTVASQGLPSQNKKLARKKVEPLTVPLFEEAAPPSIQAALSEANVNQKYAFSNFVVGQSNQLAYAAAKAVAESTYDRYNPLLIYGGVGVGKTHLLTAIAQAAILRRSGVKALYCSSETFTNEMVEAIQKRQTPSFRFRYRGLDLLLVDDIQFIAGRESTQEEFFHTFNHLYSHGKQLIFSCDRAPSTLSNLQERLKNRFTGGLVVAIDPPEIELREAILLAKSKEIGLDIEFTLLQLLARRLGPSVRVLEGALLRVSAASKLMGKRIDLPLLKTVIGLDARSEEKPPEKILEEAASFFSLSINDIKGDARTKKHVFPRQVVMYLLRKKSRLSFKKIAALLGGKDHTTALYSVNKVENLVEKGGETTRLVSNLSNKIFN